MPRYVFCKHLQFYLYLLNVCSILKQQRTSCIVVPWHNQTVQLTHYYFWEYYKSPNDIYPNEYTIHGCLGLYSSSRQTSFPPSLSEPRRVWFRHNTCIEFIYLQTQNNNIFRSEFHKETYSDIHHMSISPIARSMNNLYSKSNTSLYKLLP